MYENERQNRQQQKSELTQTKRKQIIKIFEQHEQNIQQNGRIFKYPYLISRSSQKIQQDNMSNKSTQKLKSRNVHRKKIFENKNYGNINNKIMKQSTQSVNINSKNIQDQQQLNPITNKLHNNISKNKKSRIKGSSGKSSFVKPLSMYQNIHKNQPVIFHYSSPNTLVKLNSKNLEGLQYGNPFPKAQVQVISYPLQAPPPPPPPLYNYATYYPPTSSIYPHPPQPYYQSQPQSLINSQYNQPLETKITFINTSPTTPNYLPINPTLSNIQQQYSTNQQNSPLITTSSPNRPSFSSLTQPILFHSTIQKDKQIQKQNNIKNRIIEQRKQLFKQYKQLNTNDNNYKQNLVQTYKIGENNDKNRKQITLQTKKNSPNKLIQKIYFAPQFNHQQILQSNKQDQHYDDFNKFNYQFVQEIDANFDQIDHYSDRFFDMDVQWTKNKQDQYTSQNLMRKSLSQQKFMENSKTRIQSKRQQKISIKYPQHSQKEKRQQKMEQLQQKKEVKIKKNTRQKILKMFMQIDKQGKLITLFLINIGIFLIIYQILK